MRLITGLFLFVSCITSTIKAQNSLIYNIWSKNRNYYNPAESVFDSKEVKYSASFYTKHKFVDNDDNMWKKPGNYMLNFAGKNNSLPGFYSAGYLYDGQSFYDRHSLFGGYAYSFSLNRAGNISVGARLIFNYDNMKWDKFQAGKPDNAKSGYLKPDMDFGVQYLFKGLSVGLSAKNIAQSSTQTKNNIEITSNHLDLYGNISYKFNVSKYTITPYLFAYQHRKTGLDAGVNFGMNDWFDLSYAFRIKELRHIISGRVFAYKELYLGAAIDTRGLFSDNNLDILVGYSF